MARRLEQVFGIGEIRPYSYVDRGSLDERIGYLLRTDRHIAIHGDSKQGKSWLRERALPDAQVVRVQCTTESTAAQVMQQALGLLGVRAEIRYTEERSLTGTIDLGASGQLGAKVAAQAKAQGKLSGQVGRTTSTESTAVGRTPADVPWIALVLSASGRRLVLEDFHYLNSEEQRAFSFLMKALGEYGVRVVVVGVWAEDHLLAYHNGDLSGRVEDIKLVWEDSELEEVLQKGSSELNIRFSEPLKEAMIADSFGNIGLLQRLAERVCMFGGVTTRSRRPQLLDQELLPPARSDIVDQMAGRFLTFVRRMREARPSHVHVVSACATVSDDDLRAGVPVVDLAARCIGPNGRRRYSTADLRRRLEQLADAQSRALVFPPVLSFDAVGDRLFVVDRALLFYRKYSGASFMGGPS